MACGTPVVAFDTNGSTDIIDHMTNGYLATPFVPKELARGINWMLNTDQYSQVSKNAIKKVKNNFDIAHIARKYIEFYEHVAHTKN